MLLKSIPLEPPAPGRIPISALAVGYLAAACFLVFLAACGQHPTNCQGPRQTVLKASVVVLPPTQVVSSWGDVQPGPDCPVHEQFHTFFRFNWSTEIRVSGFGEEDQPEGFTYFLYFKEHRLRKIRQIYGHEYLPAENVYEIDSKGRLERVIRLDWDRAGVGEGRARRKKRPVRETRVQYGDDTVPCRLIVDEMPLGRERRRIIVEYQFDPSGRLLSREATDEAGKPILWLRGGSAAKEVLHYNGEGDRIVRSDLLDEHGKAITTEGGIPIHLEWPDQTVFFNLYVGPNGEPLREED